MRNGYPARADSVPVARKAAAGCVRELGVEESVAQAVALAVTEVCSTVVLHAYRDQDEPGEMTVLVEKPDDSLWVTVLDDGPPSFRDSTAPGSVWGFRSFHISRTRSNSARGWTVAPRSACALT